jgi:hypothetical protein
VPDEIDANLLIGRDNTADSPRLTPSGLDYLRPGRRYSEAHATAAYRLSFRSVVALVVGSGPPHPRCPGISSGPSSQIAVESPGRRSSRARRWDEIAVLSAIGTLVLAGPLFASFASFAVSIRGPERYLTGIVRHGGPAVLPAKAPDRALAGVV